MTRSASAVVVGAGHNGLVCAIYLARAGYRVDVLEAGQSVGGSASIYEFSEGFKATGVVNAAYGLNSKICKELNINGAKKGVGTISQTIALDLEGKHLTLTENEISGAGLSQEDILSFSHFKSQFKRYAAALDPLMMNRPPRLKHMDRKDKFTLAKLGWSLRFGLGTESMREFLRVGGINIYDVLNEVFESPRLKGAIAADAVLGQQMGPRTPNTVLTYLQRLWAETEGNPNLSSASEIVEVLSATADAVGVRVSTSKRVDRIVVEKGRAIAVELETGEKISAEVIVSNTDVKSTFLHLVGSQYLDAMFCHRVHNYRCKGNVAKAFFGVSGLQAFSSLEDRQLNQRLLIAPDQRYIEHAFNHVKYGESSNNPVVEMSIPTLAEPTLAPSGYHVVSASVAYAPYEHKLGWDSQRTSFLACVMSTIDGYAPGFSDSVEVCALLTPFDIEELFNNSGGHWHHGELGIDQSFMMRPVYGTAQYETPIKGLFLCGAGTHPGGGITGVPGRNAAQRILEKGVAGK